VIEPAPPGVFACGGNPYDRDNPRADAGERDANPMVLRRRAAFLAIG
jgi:hypothetical protein